MPPRSYLFRRSTENTNAKGNAQTEPNKNYDQVSVLSPELLKFFISLVYHDCKTGSTIGFLSCVPLCVQLCSYNVLIMTWCLDVRLFSRLFSTVWTNLNLGRFYLTFWGHLFRSYQIMSRTRLANENRNRVVCWMKVKPILLIRSSHAKIIMFEIMLMACWQKPRSNDGSMHL